MLIKHTVKVSRLKVFRIAWTHYHAMHNEMPYRLIAVIGAWLIHLPKRASYRRVFWAYIWATERVHLNLWAFPSRSERPFVRKNAATSALSSQTLFIDTDTYWPFFLIDRQTRFLFLQNERVRHEGKFVIFYKLCRNMSACESAPPLHVRVPPREFDGLPSAGAAPALWTGTQESKGIDRPRKTGDWIQEPLNVGSSESCPVADLASSTVRHINEDGVR